MRLSGSARRRAFGVVGVALAAAVAVGTLSGCKTDTGAATLATVGTQRITGTEVQRYLTPQGVSAQQKAQDASQGVTTSDPSIAVGQELIRAQMFAQILQHTAGGVPSDASLAKLHDEAITQLTQSQTTGAAFDQGVRQSLPGEGITPQFAAVAIRNLELEWAVIERTKASQVSDVLSAAKKAGATVVVSKRFGSWNASQLALNAPAGGVAALAPYDVPSFVTISTASGPASGSAGG